MATADLESPEQIASAGKFPRRSADALRFISRVAASLSSLGCTRRGTQIILIMAS